MFKLARPEEKLVWLRAPRVETGSGEVPLQISEGTDSKMGN